MSLLVHAHHGQGSHLLYRLCHSQIHTVVHHSLRQLATKSVSRQGVQIQRAHTLARQCPGQVVDRAAQTGLEQAGVITDQVNQRFAGCGDLDFGIYLHHIRVITN